jgi:hypothetical protein
MAVEASVTCRCLSTAATASVGACAVTHRLRRSHTFGDAGKHELYTLLGSGSTAHKGCAKRRLLTCRSTKPAAGHAIKLN